MNKHQITDQHHWQVWAFIGDNDKVYKREQAIAELPANAVLAASNTTVILERMVRVGRVSWYDKQKRAAIRKQFKRGGI